MRRASQRDFNENEKIRASLVPTQPPCPFAARHCRDRGRGPDVNEIEPRQLGSARRAFFYFPRSVSTRDTTCDRGSSNGRHPPHDPFQKKTRFRT